MRPIKGTGFVLAGALVLFGALVVNAQQVTGVISGRVTDEKGASVPGAKVTITAKATGRNIDLVTNDEGFFEARSLPSGNYNVKIEQQGFAGSLIENLVVQTGKVSDASVQLKVGNISETVTVQGTEAQLQVDTTRQTLDGVITGQQIVKAPLNGRNFLDLAAFQPGVQIRDGGVIDPTKTGTYRTVGVNGSSGTGTRIQIDGIDVTDETVGTTVSNVSTDAVQEFGLSRASFDISTSLSTTGAINIVTRSGNNEWHGSGFYVFRNEKLGARINFEKTGLPFHRKTPGFRFGGPIKKDKVFFFTNAEWNYEGTQSIVTSSNFPQLNGSVSFPTRFRYALEKIDFNLSKSVTGFYEHKYDDNLTTGGSGSSPFQNIDWTIVHTIGLNITRPRWTHSIRLGYVNFNNRIESQELNPFKFPLTPQGFPYLLTVGADFNEGPNVLAPQQTYQDSKQVKYDGSHIRGNHTIRFGGEFNRIILGGFANFSGPMQAVGQFNAAIQAGLPAAQRTDPLAYPLLTFSVGVNSGFFTFEPAHGLPHGGHFNTRTAWYLSDSWKVRPNFTLNFGTRWTYDTGFYTPQYYPVLHALDVYGDPKLGQIPKLPKHLFGPQLGFAWDPKHDGKMSVRGGAYLTYEMNVFNNTLYDGNFRLPPGIGPDGYVETGVFGPTGAPIVVNGIPNCPASEVAQGVYTCMVGQPISTMVQYIAQINLALQAAYTGLTFDPNKGQSSFDITKGVTAIGALTPGDAKVPYGIQFNIGIQRELRPNLVFSIDYVRNRQVGLPLIRGEVENRRDAAFLDAVGARAKVASVVGVPVAQLTLQSIDAYIATHPIATISAFGLASDTFFTGRTTTLTRARVQMPGFALYNGLQMQLNGRFTSEQMNRFSLGGHKLLRTLQYTMSYALGRAQATQGNGRVEFLGSEILDNHCMNCVFGPTSLDRTHIFGAGVNIDSIGGFRFNTVWSFRTPTPQNLLVPAIDTLSSANRMFTTDINGDGGSGTSPRTDILPGTVVGALGRNIRSFAQLNRYIRAFNQTYAGQVTPNGAALVRAGLFTADQLRQLGAVIRAIPEVPLTNPWPFQNLFNLDMKIARPIKIKERYEIEPSLDIFNVFNHTALGQYSGLSGACGSLNYDYVADPNGKADPKQRCDVSVLTSKTRNRAQSTRLLQLSIRFTF